MATHSSRPRLERVLAPLGRATPRAGLPRGDPGLDWIWAQRQAQKGNRAHA